MAICLLVHLVLLINAQSHDPHIGYDANGHREYIRALASGHLPGKEDSREYFSPPLPYVPAALVYAVDHDEFSDLDDAGKVTQYLHVGFSLILVWALLRVCSFIQPGSIWLRSLALLLLGMMPVYYKTFAFVRGEPMLAMFYMLAIYLALRLWVACHARRRRLVLLGGILGLMVLCRQWAFFIFPSLFIFLVILAARGVIPFRRTALELTAVCLIAFAVGSWYYFSLHSRFGSFTAFNRRAHKDFPIMESSVGRSFPFPVHKMLSSPVRNAFPNQFVPVFYADFWGDYWFYFLIYGWDAPHKDYLDGATLAPILTNPPPYPAGLSTNLADMQRYLGRVNLLAIVPTLVLLGGLVVGMYHLLRMIRSRERLPATSALALLTLIVLCSAAGYFWFLVRYCKPDIIDTAAKPSYVLHAFPMIAILGAYGLNRLRERRAVVFYVLLSALILVALHNLPACFTRDILPHTILAWLGVGRF